MTSPVPVVLICPSWTSRTSPSLPATGGASLPLARRSGGWRIRLRCPKSGPAALIRPSPTNRSGGAPIAGRASSQRGGAECFAEIASAVLTSAWTSAEARPEREALPAYFGIIINWLAARHERGQNQKRPTESRTSRWGASMSVMQVGRPHDAAGQTTGEGTCNRLRAI